MFDELPNQHRIGVMTRTMSDDECVEVKPQKSQIADHVENLVPHALIGMAELIPNHAILAEDEEIRVGGPNSNPSGSERGGFRFEQECAAGRQFVAEGLRSQPDTTALRWDNRGAAVVEVVRKRQSTGSIWVNRKDCVSFLDAEGTINDQGPAQAILIDRSGTVQRLDENTAGTIAPGALARIDLHQAVVDLQAGQGGHHMLDHLHGRGASSDRSTALGGNDISDPRRHSGSLRQIAALEDDPGVGLCRAELQGYIRPMEKPNSAHFRDTGQRTLRTRRFQH
jgi:hypothetical protein